MPFQIIPEFVGSPGGVCFTCRSSRRPNDVIVDCDFDVEELNALVPTEIPGMAFEVASGALQICGTCVAEMGNLIGMVSGARAAEMKHAIAKLEEALDAARAHAEAAEAAIKQMDYFNQTKAVADRVFGSND